MTVSLVVTAVLSLYNGVVKDHARVKHLRKMCATLRDALRRRFLGIFCRVKMGYSADILKEPFVDRVYLTASILDPNLKLAWVDIDVQITADDDIDDEESEERARDELKRELKGKQGKDSPFCRQLFPVSPTHKKGLNCSIPKALVFVDGKYKDRFFLFRHRM